ncbi:MAG: tRNA-binding protein [Gemmatimonadetes bacterium]|nr:tRNA-binding protein [Gemmatimonadota bacterium]NNK49563.1 tRNA-binding protein [Gemmatimonadota bacterium]
MSTIEYDEFAKVDIRVGTIVEADEFLRARKPLYRLRIDFGPEVGVRQSAAGLPGRYGLEELVGRQVIAVLNLGVRNIAGFESQCLTLGLPDDDGETILLSPASPVPDGGRLF